MLVVVISSTEENLKLAFFLVEQASLVHNSTSVKLINPIIGLKNASDYKNIFYNMQDNATDKIHVSMYLSQEVYC